MPKWPAPGCGGSPPPVRPPRTSRHSRPSCGRARCDRSSGSIFQFGMRLEPIAVRIDDKGGVVAGAIIGAQAGLAIVLAARFQGRRMEGVDPGAPLGLEAQMQSRAVV